MYRSFCALPGIIHTFLNEHSKRVPDTTVGAHFTIPSHLSQPNDHFTDINLY